MKKIIIDRFEGDIAVCECDDFSMVNISCTLLPKGVSVGNIIVLNDDGSIINDQETEHSRKEKLFDLYDNLFDKE